MWLGERLLMKMNMGIIRNVNVVAVPRRPRIPRIPTTSKAPTRMQEPSHRSPTVLVRGSWRFTQGTPAHQYANHSE